MTKEELVAQLSEMNSEINKLTKQRTEFIMSHLSDFAEFQIDERVYNVKLKRPGTVTKYRTWDENPTSFSCYCEIEVDNNRLNDNSTKFVDNTSHDRSVWIKLEDYVNKTPEYIHRLESAISQQNAG